MSLKPWFSVLILTHVFWLFCQAGAIPPLLAQGTSVAAKEQEATLLGFVRLARGRVISWGTTGTPTNLPLPDVHDLRELNTVAVVRIPENTHLQVTYHGDTSSYYTLRSWRSATDSGVVFVDLDIPTDRYSGELHLSLSLVGKATKSWKLESLPAGERQYIGEN